MNSDSEPNDRFIASGVQTAQRDSSIIIRGAIRSKNAKDEKKTLCGQNIDTLNRYFFSFPLQGGKCESSFSTWCSTRCVQICPSAHVADSLQSEAIKREEPFGMWTTANSGNICLPRRFP